MADHNPIKLVEYCVKLGISYEATLAAVMCFHLCTKDGALSKVSSMIVEDQLGERPLEELVSRRLLLTSKSPIIVNSDVLDMFLARPKKRKNVEVDEGVSASFERLWQMWPSRSQDGKLVRGDKLPALHNFRQLVEEGKATAEELEKAARIYIEEHPNVKSGFIRQVRTFLNPEEGIWYESVEIVRNREAAASRSAATA